MKPTTDDLFLLFEEPLEGKLLREVRELKLSHEKVRKGQFAKIGELRKMYQALSDDMEIIKRGLCRPQENNCEIIEMVSM